MRTLLPRLLILACLALAAAAPGVATAQTDPFGGLPPSAPQTTTVAPTTTTRAGDDGLKRWQQTLIFLAGVALLAGIGFAIVGDARRVAPVSEQESAGAHAGGAAGARKTHDKAKARKKAKAARAARKQNR